MVRGCCCGAPDRWSAARRRAARAPGSANAPIEIGGVARFDRGEASPRPGAASRNCSRITALETLSGFQSSATRAADGMISLMSCSRFGPRSGAENGVAGDVAAGTREALHQAGAHRIADRSCDDRDGRGGGLGGAALPACHRSRSHRPAAAPVRPPRPGAAPDLPSAVRYSKAMVWPSTYPASRSASRKRCQIGPSSMMPMRGNFPRAAARAWRAAKRAAPPPRRREAQ